MKRFRELAAFDPALRLAGWLVGVLVRLPGEKEPVRHYWPWGWPIGPGPSGPPPTAPY
ncbi:MAG: hypothetical protein WDN45_00280 [Caulobacteraceae bacterium]